MLVCFYCKNKGLIKIEKKKRNTVQKKIIYEILKEFKNHPTVEDVYAEVKKTHANISKNTVYRNLRQLADDGKIRKVSLPGEQERYDNATVQHYHYQCKICNSIYDIGIEYLDSINETVSKMYGFQIDEHELVFRGICPKCVDAYNKSSTTK